MSPSSSSIRPASVSRRLGCTSLCTITGGCSAFVESAVNGDKEWLDEFACRRLRLRKNKKTARRMMRRAPRTAPTTAPAMVPAEGPLSALLGAPVGPKEEDEEDEDSATLLLSTSPVSTSRSKRSILS